MSVVEVVRGCAGAPLVATMEYQFERGFTPAGEGRLGIPWMQRGSWDDRGSVVRVEQEVFVDRLIASIGATARGGDPGEWIFVDPVDLECTWSAIVESLREPAKWAPTATAQRAVSREEAAKVADGLTPRFLALVQAVIGLREPFVCVDSRIDYGDYDQCTRRESWRSGDVLVSVEGEGITSGHGVHGESGSRTVTAPGSEGRGASVSSRIDMRHGGSVSVTVQGVLDGQALADRFVAPES